MTASRFAALARKGWHYAKVYALSIWVVLVTVGLLFGIHNDQKADDADARRDARAVQAAILDDAEACVTAWDVSEAIRDAIEGGYRRNAETLLGLAAGTATTPEEIAVRELYAQAVERDVQFIRSTIPDPTCDLEAARRVIDKKKEA